MKKMLGLMMAMLFIFSLSDGFASTFETDDETIIYYEVKGSGDPIVFVHGWTMSSKFWQKQVDELSKNYQVVTMDLRGHGNSAKTLEGHTVPQYARDVYDLIRHLKLRRVTLVGWSLAGPVVLSCYEQFKNHRIKALGLVDMTPFPFSPEGWNSHGLKNYNYAGMNATFLKLEENRRGVANGFVNKMFHNGVAPPEDLEWMVTEHLKTPTSVSIAAYADYLMRDYTGILSKIKLPVIVFSANSGVFQKSIQMGKWVSSQIPNATFVPVENAGHLLFYEQAEKFNGALDQFLKSIN
ncbi:alpha/beta hydrolase [Desulfonema ishimotonii]|uniref:Alpha/beta hydrolase n=1 Tax=Desulfonema ishimotonii TaxID=45657 RepID=A0A401G305_9BACT|nr:alpha/beta hydrolase [Desulfonema ishimotonii]GBC63561.1 alpha/beta hydrolase [Desulfonema ishimotonii]